MFQLILFILALVFSSSIIAYFSSSFSLMLIAFAILAILFVLPKDARFDNLRYYLVLISLAIFGFLTANAIAKLGVETLLNTISDMTNTILVYIIDNPFILFSIAGLVALVVVLRKKLNNKKVKGVNYVTTRAYRISAKNK